MTATASDIRVAVAAERPLEPMRPVRRAWVDQIMGLPISVHVRAADTTREDIAVGVRRVFDHLRLVDRVFSTWRADSDLLRLQHGEVEPDEAHPWLAEVTDLCLEAEGVTDGLFSAWRCQAGGRRVFDPTGLVKGWGVAGAAAHLEVLDEIQWCIGAGGDLLAGTGRGMVDMAPTWRVGIEDPRDRRRIADVITLSRNAVATSGSAARGAHIHDPSSGAPIDRVGSTTVIGPDLMWADVWATAAFVNPARAGLLIADRAPDYSLLTL